MPDWWKTFFDADYLRLWGGMFSPERNTQHADALWQLLRLQPASRVLDAPCGYGRLSVPLAERGASVLGVDQSETLLAQAQRDNPHPDRLRYLQHDLRQPLPEGNFDAAFNVFSSIGYGTEDEDFAILTNIRNAVRPGGFVFLDTNHRDIAVAFLARGVKPTQRLADGTLIIEEPTFDPIAGRINTCWYWSGPSGSGSKPASIRVYSITELIRLMDRAGLRFLSAHKGCLTEPFKAEGTDMGGRVGILSEVAR